jgi:hypothetical protein
MEFAEGTEETEKMHKRRNGDEMKRLAATAW